MTQGVRPDGQIFASQALDGELESFPANTRGWGVTIDGNDASGNKVTDPTNGIPPMEWMNGVLNQLSNQILWNMQHAIPSWLAGTWDAAAFVTYTDGWVYYNKSTNATTGEPSSSADWVKIFPLSGIDTRYLQTTNNLSEIAASGANAQASGRSNLGLGTAATHNVQTSPTDTTAGAVLMVDAFGLGGSSTQQITDDELVSPDVTPTQFFDQGGGTDNEHFGGYGAGIHLNYGTASGNTQRATANLFIDSAGNLSVEWLAVNIADSSIAVNKLQKLYGPLNKPTSVDVNAIEDDGCHVAGFVGGDATKPYMRHTASNAVVELAMVSDLSAYITTSTAKATFVTAPRFGANKSVTWGSGGGTVPAGCTLTGGNFDDETEYAYYAYLQYCINGTWINATGGVGATNSVSATHYQAVPEGNISQLINLQPYAPANQEFPNAQYYIDEQGFDWFEAAPKLYGTVFIAFDPETGVIHQIADSRLPDTDAYSLHPDGMSVKGFDNVPDDCSPDRTWIYDGTQIYRSSELATEKALILNRLAMYRRMSRAAAYLSTLQSCAVIGEAQEGDDALILELQQYLAALRNVDLSQLSPDWPTPPIDIKQP